MPRQKATTSDSPYSQRRFGRFYLPLTAYVDNPLAVQALMAVCMPVRVEYHLAAEQIEFVAASDFFEPIKPGATPPAYGAWASYDEAQDVWCPEFYSLQS